MRAAIRSRTPPRPRRSSSRLPAATRAPSARNRSRRYAPGSPPCRPRRRARRAGRSAPRARTDPAGPTSPSRRWAARRGAHRGAGSGGPWPGSSRRTRRGGRRASPASARSAGPCGASGRRCPPRSAALAACRIRRTRRWGSGPASSAPPGIQPGGRRSGRGPSRSPCRRRGPGWSWWGTLDQWTSGRYRRGVWKAFTKEDDLTPEVVVPQRPKAPPPETAPIEQLRGEGKARLGARVKLSAPDGHEAEYRLVTPDQADPTHGAVSVESPLGRALLGKSAGEEVTVERPRGPLDYTIEGVYF